MCLPNQAIVCAVLAPAAGVFARLRLSALHMCGRACELPKHLAVSYVHSLHYPVPNAG